MVTQALRFGNVNRTRVQGLDYKTRPARSVNQPGVTVSAAVPDPSRPRRLTSAGIPAVGGPTVCDLSETSSIGSASGSSNGVLNWDPESQHMKQVLAPVTQVHSSHSKAEIRKMKRADQWPTATIIYRGTGLGVLTPMGISRNLIGSPTTYEQFLTVAQAIPIVDAVVRGVSGVVMLFYAKARVHGGDWKNRFLKIIDGTRAGLAFAYLGSVLGNVIASSSGAFAVGKALFTASFSFVVGLMGLTLVKDSFELMLAKHDRSSNRQVLGRVERRAVNQSRPMVAESTSYRQKTIDALIKKDQFLKDKVRAYRRLSMGSLLMLLGVVSGWTWVAGLPMIVWGSAILLRQSIELASTKTNQRRALKIRDRLDNLWKSNSESTTEEVQRPADSGLKDLETAKLAVQKALRKLPESQFSRWNRFSRAIDIGLGRFRKFAYNGRPHDDTRFRIYKAQSLKIQQVETMTEDQLKTEIESLDNRACEILGAQKIVNADGHITYEHDPKVNPRGFAIELVDRWLCSGDGTQERPRNPQLYQLICDILGPRKVNRIFFNSSRATSDPFDVQANRFGQLAYTQKISKLAQKHHKKTEMTDLTDQDVLDFARKYLAKQVLKRVG